MLKEESEGLSCQCPIERPLRRREGVRSRTTLLGGWTVWREMTMPVG